MEEIIYYGQSIGTRRYDILLKKWIIKLNEAGLSLLQGKISKRWVKVGDGAVEPISNGANILIPGVIDADPEIMKGDYIAVVDKQGKIIAGGIARISEQERDKHEKGVYAKFYTSVRKTVQPILKEVTWDDVVYWNIESLQRVEKKAIEYIKKVKDDLDLPISVSYSGGKDSLVTLALVREALPQGSYKILFVDTGIEFPETVKYVEESSLSLGFNQDLIVEEASSELFWNAIEKFGPPGRDFRHCCKFAKLAPIQRAIETQYKGEKCISFVGQRRYESFRRAVTDIWENQYVPNQINVSPIQDWTAFMIWLYIFWKELPYNPLYDIGYERIGCWACPSTNMAQFKVLEERHPELYSKLNNSIEDWRKKRGLSKEYLELGLWRFKKLPKKILNILPKDITDLQPKSKGEYGLQSLDFEASDCITKPITVIGTFTTSIDLQEIESGLNMIGKVQINAKLNLIRVNSKKFSIIVYNDGTFKIIFKKQDNLTIRIIRETIQSFVFTVLRAVECINCGLCVSKCHQKAILIINNKVVVNSKKCTKCNQCFSVCPIVTIVHREINDEIKTAIKKNRKEISSSPIIE